MICFNISLIRSSYINSATLGFCETVFKLTLFFRFYQLSEIGYLFNHVIQHCLNLGKTNRPFPSSKKSQLQSEAKCEAIDMKMIFNYDANKTHFHNKGFALSLVLKVRFLELGNGPFEHSNKTVNSHSYLISYSFIHFLIHLLRNMLNQCEGKDTRTTFWHFSNLMRLVCFEKGNINDIHFIFASSYVCGT